MTIPEGVLKIGEGAFAGCAVLTGVTVPEGAEEIEKEAFLGCAGLRRVTLPVGLARIGKCAFKDCVSLEEIHFPKGLCQIGESAFAGCVRLKEAMLPEGLTDMGRLAFYGCEGLLQAEIPGSLRELASSVFGDCVSLKRIVLHEGLEAVSIYAFSNCRSLSELELPRGLASVGYGSFQGCAGLTRLTIPKDTRLEFDGRTVPHQTTPFADSVSLTDIQVDGENPYYEAQDGGLYEKGCGNLIFWFGTGERAVIPAFVSRLAVGAFESRKDLKEFAVEPGNTKFIAQGPALYKLDKKKNPVLVCWALNQGEAVIAPGTVRIERRAFAGRDKLTGVRIPDSVTNIEREAFWGCASLEEVHIPGSVRTLRERTFFGCTRLKQVDFSEGLEKTEHSVFENCKALEELHFPQSMVHICASSFRGCTSLKRVTASKNLTSFPYRPHYNSREGLPYFSLEPSFLAGREACPEQLFGVLWCASEEDLARAALFQTGEEWKKAMGRRLEAEPELTDGIIRNMIVLLKEEGKPEKALWERAAAFVLAWKEQAGEEVLGAFYEMCREGACPVLDELEASASQAEDAADTVRAECAADAAQADSAESAADAAQAEGAESAKAQAERAAEENWIDGTLVQDMGRKVKQGVPYAGSGSPFSRPIPWRWKMRRLRRGRITFSPALGENSCICRCGSQCTGRKRFPRTAIRG